MINAVLGIVALIVGDFGEEQGKILMTSLSVSAASVLSLMMFPARERGLLGHVPIIGIGLSVVGFGLLVILVWTEFREDILARSVGSILTFAVAAGYASLISMAVVQPKYAIVVRAAYLLVALLSVMIAIVIWGEVESELMPRTMGVMSILLAAATVSIPVLHRLNRQNASHAGLSEGRKPARCVRCGSAELSSSDGYTYECGACQTRFNAKILI